MAENNSKTFISGIVIFAVLVILGFMFFTGKDETAPVITEEYAVEVPAIDEVESADDAAIELDGVFTPEEAAPAAGEAAAEEAEAVVVEETPVAEEVVAEEAPVADEANEDAATEVEESVTEEQAEEVQPESAE